MVESLILSSRNSLPTNIQFKILDHLFEKFNQIEDKDKVECTKKIEEVIECFIKKSSCFVVPNHGIVSVQSNQDIPVEVNKSCGGCGKTAVKGTFGKIIKYSTIIECTECKQWYHKDKPKSENCADVSKSISKKKTLSWECKQCITKKIPKDDEIKGTSQPGVISKLKRAARMVF
jgi:hypothetical protein